MRTKDFVKHLNSLSKKKLIKIIVDTLDNNPYIALNYNLKKLSSSESFVEEFIDECSYSKLEKASEMLTIFSFEQLARMLSFVEDHGDEIYDNSSDEYDDDGSILYEFECRLKEELVKKIKTEAELKEALKLESANDEIIKNAEQFVKSKDIIKSSFSKENYLEFLLRLKNPDLKEIRENITKKNQISVLGLPLFNLTLADKLAVFLNDKKLLFLVALYKKDFKDLVKYFKGFDEIIKLDYYILTPKLSAITGILMKNKFQDKQIAEKLIKKDFINNYEKKSLKYLCSQINDYDYIKSQIDFEREFSKNHILFERLIELNNTEAAKLLKEQGNLLKGKHWKDVVEILKFLRKNYGDDYIKKLIEKNGDVFANSGALKSNLKKEHIFISYKKGVLKVAVG